MHWHRPLVLLLGLSWSTSATGDEDVATQTTDEGEAWMTGDRSDATYGLGGSSVLATWTPGGHLNLDVVQRLGPLRNYSESWMPPVFSQQAENVSVGMGYGGDTAGLRLSRRSGSKQPAGEKLEMSFTEWARQANWNVANPETGVSSHLLAELIAEITPFLEQEHPVELKPCLRNTISEADGFNCQGKHDGADFVGKRPRGDAFMVDVSIFGFDLDTLELKMLELQDVIDLFVVFEMPLTHKGTPKPLLWARNKDTPRFAKLSPKVLHIIVDDQQVLDSLKLQASTKTLHDVQFGEERTQEKQGNGKLQHLLKSVLRHPLQKQREILVNYGDTDEIAAPYNLQLLKVCQPKRLPLDHGAWMVQGRLSTAFKSDFPVSDRYPYAHGNPCAQTLDALKGRCFGSSGQFLLGGWHLTGYPYIPFVVMKLLTASEYKGLGPEEFGMLTSGTFGLEEYYTKTDISSDMRMALKTMPLRDLITTSPYKNRPELLRTPCTMHKNPERYEAWFGTNDRRLELPARQKAPVVVNALSEMSQGTEHSKDEHFERRLVRRHIEMASS